MPSSDRDEAGHLLLFGIWRDIQDQRAVRRCTKVNRRKRTVVDCTGPRRRIDVAVLGISRSTLVRASGTANATRTASGIGQGFGDRIETKPRILGFDFRFFDAGRFGLLQDSAAVIIGAMLIAPLMTPIMGPACRLRTATVHCFDRRC